MPLRIEVFGIPYAGKDKRRGHYYRPADLHDAVVLIREHNLPEDHTEVVFYKNCGSKTKPHEYTYIPWKNYESRGGAMNGLRPNDYLSEIPEETAMKHQKTCKVIIAAAIVLVLLGVYTVAQAQVQMMPQSVPLPCLVVDSDGLKTQAEEFGESLIWEGKIQNGMRLRIYQSAEGEWTSALIHPSGAEACIPATGFGGTLLPVEPLEPVEPLPEGGTGPLNPA